MKDKKRILSMQEITENAEKVLAGKSLKNNSKELFERVLKKAVVIKKQHGSK